MKVKNICIDTEGAQVRTSNVKKKFLKKEDLQDLLQKKDIPKKN